jgi:hypothetical protein
MSVVSQSVIDIPTERGMTFSSIGIITGLLLDDRDVMALLLRTYHLGGCCALCQRDIYGTLIVLALGNLGTINVSCESVSYRHTDGERHNVLLDRYHNWTLTW